MSTQLQSHLMPSVPTIVNRNAQNPFATKDLTLLAATLSPLAPPGRETLVTAAPGCQPAFREDLAQYVRTALLATDASDAAITTEHFEARRSGLKGAGLRSRTAPRAEPGISEGSQTIWQVGKPSPLHRAERAIDPKLPDAPCWLEPGAICANH
jgi:hypothetical protein